MYTLLLCDKHAEVVLNSCMEKLRENANIDMIYHVHDRLNVVCWRKSRDQSMRVCEEV